MLKACPYTKVFEISISAEPVCYSNDLEEVVKQYNMILTRMGIKPISTLTNSSAG
jgi:hypothetical protein